MAACVAALAAGVAALASVAGAAGTGYGSEQPQGTTVPGGFTSVVTSRTLPASGGVVAATFAGGTISVDVPAGAFAGPVQVSVLAPSTALAGAVVAFDLSFATGGQSVSGSFATAVTCVVANPSITSSDVVDVWDGSRWVVDPRASVSAGTATIVVTADPAFAVEPSSMTTVTGPVTEGGGSTSPGASAGRGPASPVPSSRHVAAAAATAGIPVLGWVGISFGVVLIGATGLVLARRRRAGEPS